MCAGRESPRVGRGVHRALAPFSFAEPANECAVAEALSALGLPLSVSHRILLEFREYERASTVVANAYLAPKMRSYLEALEAGIRSRYPGGELEVMQSSGGIISGANAAEEPVRTVLSGPAGGVIGAHAMAALSGFTQIISFDMGGTSTDVCLIDGAAGGPRISNEAVIAGVPISVPMLDIHTVGAGGGSIARFDGGGLLRVGPESAGSVPGPVCFGGGERPTVTDANLLLGRIDGDTFLDGSVKLDVERTRAVLDREKGVLASAEIFAAGIVRVVQAAMERAVRQISIERGYDPREFTLVAFGGGGPLHAVALARALRMPRVCVPRLPGALSALGILLAESVRDYSQTIMLPLEGSDLEPHFRELASRADDEAGHARSLAESRMSADLRYGGQGFELNVPFGPHMASAFHGLHRRLYGFSDTSRPVEVVNLRLRRVSPGEPLRFAPEPCADGEGTQAVVSRRLVHFDHGPVLATVYDRSLLRPGDAFPGPAIVSEYSSATLLPPGDRLRIDAYGNMVIEIAEEVR